MPGLFGTLNIGTSGMSAQQKAIDVSSHNIANANTEGYSRQRAVMKTGVPYCMPNFDMPGGTGQMGTGVDVNTVARIRDGFIDYQVRVENGVSGQYTGRDSYLSQIENIFNEKSETGISATLSSFFSAWNDVYKQPQVSTTRTTLVTQTNTLLNQIKHVYSELEKLKSNCQSSIKNDLLSINDDLNQLSKVNEQIMQVSIGGDNPNDLMDTRDAKLDDLSSKFGFNIIDRTLNGIDVTTSNQPVDSTYPSGGSAPLDANGNPMNIVQLVNPDSSCRFSYINSIVDSNGKDGYNGAGAYTVTYYKNADMTNDANKVTFKVNLTSENQYNELMRSRTLWSDSSGVALKVTNGTNGTSTVSGSITNNSTCNFSDLKLFEPPTGELKGYMSVQDDITNYEDQLDKLTKAIALSVNAVHSQSQTWKADDTSNKVINNFFVNKDDPNTAAGESNITAENIEVNPELDPELGGNVMLIQAGSGTGASGEGDGNRALAICQIQNLKLAIQNIDAVTYTRQQLVTGMSKDSTLGILTANKDADGRTMNEAYIDTIDTLGVKEQEAKKMVTNQNVLLAGLKERREATSGVSLDEEMAGMIQYQHAYQANAKIISTVDQLLDVVVNNLKR